jgi:small conductance mechanosensitive channel
MDIQAILQGWLKSFIEFLPKIISALVIFFISVFGAGFLAKSVKKLSSKRIGSAEIQQLVFRITRWTIIVIGTIVALEQVNFNVTGFIAGLGVAGFTIGFALQDIAKNFISGLLLLYRQPFLIGDYVQLSDYSGTVKQINIRDTEIETLDGELVIIPNRDVFENAIINYTSSALRRRSVSIGLGYGEDVERATDVFINAIKGVEGVEDDPQPSIIVRELGDSALMMEARFWINQREASFLDVHSKVVTVIKKAAEENKINLPYPVQTIRLEKLD